MEGYVPGFGCSSAKLVIVGEAPGAHEVARGFPFAGPAGALVDECLANAGYSRDLCYITNVSKYRPPNNEIERLRETGHTIEEQLPQLWQELEAINPNCILALGNTALTALTGNKGIEKYRGSIMTCFHTGHKLVASLHPASLMHEAGGEMKSWKELAYIKKDFERAVAQSAFREVRLPERNLMIAHTSLDVFRFLDAHQKDFMVTLDVETYKTWAQCIGLAFCGHEALSIPTFWKDEIPLHDQAYIWRLLAEFLHDTKIKIVAQNAKFDEKRCRQLGLDWHDCWMDMAMGWHVLFPEFPKKLQFISSMVTEEPYYKDEGSEYNPKIHKIDRWFLYNAKDAAVEYECTERILEELKDSSLLDFFFEKIMPLHRLYYDIEDTGILIDKEIRKQLRKKYVDLWDKKQAVLIDNICEGDPQIREVYKNFNVMSNGPKNQVAKLIYGFLKCPIRKDTADDTLKALANNAIKDKRRKDILFGILEVRKLRKTIGTYIDAKASLDGRIHTQCNVNGTESGRTSTGILKPPVCNQKEGIALQTMTKHEDVNLDAGGGDLRSMFIADPGWTFIEPDLAQAEDRVVCVLAKDWDALRDYERTVFKYNKHGLKDDRHTTTAMYVCALGFDGVTDWDRQIGKKTRHAGNYNIGKHQQMLTLGKAGVFLSEWAVGKQLERFHGENPKIRGIFHADIVQALIDNECVLFSPLGRRRIFFNKWGEDLFKEAYAQIPQSTVSDQVKFAMVRIRARIPTSDFLFVEESHDSFLALCRTHLVDRYIPIIKEELEQPIDFRKCTLSRDYQLVIPCDIKTGQRWIEANTDWPDGMKKYKVAA